MARHAELFLVPAFAIMAASSAQAADRESISIAPGRLGEAVIALGRQTGASIGMSDQSLAGIATPAVSGSLSVEAALKRLLKGSPATAQRIDANTWRIVRRRAAPRSLPSPPETPLAPPAPEDAPSAEIIVTASKRDTPLQRYAGLVQVVDHGGFPAGDAASGSAALLARVASLTSTHAGAGRNKLFLRGIADSGVAGPTQATTGQYLGDMRLNYAAPDPDLRLHDMQSVEVLEGPQGTLYGAGSLGGIIRMTPNPPNLALLGGQLSAGVSATEHGDPGADLAATLNLPILPEKLAVRLVGYAVSEAGYIDDILRGESDVNRTRIYGGRAGLRYAPNDDWTIDATGVYQRIEGEDAQYADMQVAALARASSVAQPYSSDYALANLRIERQWDDLRFISSSGAIRHILSESYDATQPDTPPTLFRQRNRVSIFSTENRIMRDRQDGIGWILGVSYLESTSAISRSLTSYGPAPVLSEVIPGVPLYGRGMPATTTGVRNRIREGTLFGEASFEPMPHVVATVGGRLTHSRLTGRAIDPGPLLAAALVAAAEAKADRRETIFLPSFALLTDAARRVTLYARFQQGFRPGGLAVDDQHVLRFSNDRVSTLEFGFRKGIPGRDPVAVSASFAWTDWDDIQADVIDRIGLPTTANIGDGRIYTAEGRFVARLASRVTIDGSIIYNDSRLQRPAPFVRMLNGPDRSIRLPNVADWGGRIALDYRAPIDDVSSLHISASGRYVGTSRLGVGSLLGRTQGDYVDTMLSASIIRGPLQISAALTNLRDSRGNRFSLGTPFNLSGGYTTPQRPRTLRLGLDFAF